MVQQYKVSDALWLNESVALAKAILTTPTNISKTWTVASFNTELDRIGITYTGAELGLIAAKLLADGDLVTV